MEDEIPDSATIQAIVVNINISKSNPQRYFYVQKPQSHKASYKLQFNL